MSPLPLDLGLARPDLLRDASFIDGSWQSGGTAIQVTNPADDSLVGSVPDFGEAEAAAAVSAADRAQKEWSARTGKERGHLLRRWAELMLLHREDLARIMTAEQGKPLAEARGEVAYAASFFEWFGEEARRVTGELLTPHLSNSRLMVRKEPIGVVAAITPWNFPLAMITRKAAPALAVGCTMVIRPAELTPLSALAIARLSEEAGIPAGVFNVITGAAKPIGAVLTGDKRVRKFTFTGSTPVGKLLAAQCAATVKRMSLELGGNAPFIVFDDADLDSAVDGAIASKFRNSGQTCVCANRFLVQAGIYAAFASALAERVARLTVGPGLAGPFDQGPLINEQAVSKVIAHVEDAVSRGGRVLTGGARVDGPGYFFHPTVIEEVPASAILCSEETFGPVAGLVRFETEEEAIALANQSDSGLAAYVFTRNLDRSVRVTEALEVGMIGLNTGAISTEVAPFGGVKESGIGREGSRHGIEEYLEMKLVCLGLGNN